MTVAGDWDVKHQNKQNKTSVDGTPSQIPAFYLTKAPAKFEFSMSNSLGGDAFIRKYITVLFKAPTFTNIL